MAEITDILRWPDGRGWIVLSGGDDEGSAIRAQALRLIPTTDGAVVYIGLSESSSDETLDDMEDLGAPTGYLVNVLAEDDDSIRRQIGDAGLLMIDDTEPTDTLRSSLIGAGEQGMRAAYERGAIVLAEGSNARMFGKRLLDEKGSLVEGFNWLQNALILPGITSLRQSEIAQHVLGTDADAIVIGIGGGSALALGPDGAVEIWGNRQVTLALGRNYQSL